MILSNSNENGRKTLGRGVDCGDLGGLSCRLNADGAVGSAVLFFWPCSLLKTADIDLNGDGVVGVGDLLTSVGL